MRLEEHHMSTMSKTKPGTGWASVNGKLLDYGGAVLLLYSDPATDLVPTVVPSLSLSLSLSLGVDSWGREQREGCCIDLACPPPKVSGASPTHVP